MLSTQYLYWVARSVAARYPVPVLGQRKLRLTQYTYWVDRKLAESPTPRTPQCSDRNAYDAERRRIHLDWRDVSCLLSKPFAVWMHQNYENSEGLVRCVLFIDVGLRGVNAAKPLEFLGFDEMHPVSG